MSLEPVRRMMGHAAGEILFRSARRRDIMFGRGVRLFRLLGFEVRLDWSWLIIALLVTWSLARGVFPYQVRGLSPGAYWWMGAAGALGLFVSIVLHELGHSVVARQFGIPMRGITLFVFGGVAEMEREPPTPRSEFLMAIAGPITSIVLAGIFYGMGRVAEAASWPIAGFLVVSYLAWINLALAIFNMVPAFPLDGGRVLRSVLWATQRNFQRATNIASRVGSGFGVLLMLLGVLSFVFGNFITGVWWLVLGLFLREASRASYQQALLREVFAGEPVQRFMTPNPVTVPPATSVRDVVEDYIYKYHHKLIPVANDERELVGCVTVNQIRQIPREDWNRRTAQEVATPCSAENSVAPNDDAVKALSMMRRNQASRLMVVDHGHLVGVITLKDLLKFLSLKIELEGA